MNIARFLRFLAFLAAVSAGWGATPEAPAYEPPRVSFATRPILPPEIKEAEIGALVRVMFMLSETGRARDTMVVEASHEAFGRAMVHALSGWRFQPAKSAGRPIATRVFLALEIDDADRVNYRLEETQAIVNWITDDAPHTYRIATLVDLDHRPTPVRPVMPEIPDHLADIDPGTVVVDFFINERGQVVAPIILEAKHPDIAQATGVAMRQWRFSPPRRDGRPSNVWLRMPLDLAPEPRDRQPRDRRAAKRTEADARTGKGEEPVDPSLDKVDPEENGKDENP